MRRKPILTAFLVVIALLGVAPALIGAQSTPALRYAVTDLGEIKDYSSTAALALNAKGVVVGQAYDPMTYLGRAVIYRGGGIRALIKGEQGTSAAHDVNASVQIVGYAQAEMTSPGRAMLWESNVATDLGDLGGDSSNALAINDAGMVVG